MLLLIRLLLAIIDFHPLIMTMIQLLNMRNSCTMETDIFDRILTLLIISKLRSIKKSN